MLTNKIMHRLALFNEIAREDWAPKATRLAQAKTRLNQAAQACNEAKTVADLKNTLEEELRARVDVEFHNAQFQYAEGFKNAVELLTQSIQSEIESYREREAQSA